jgi:hypothetical protein
MPIQFYSKAQLAQRRDPVEIPANLDIRDHIREMRNENGHLVYEFIGNDDFGTEWVTRQRYEVDAGRDQEPILYTPLFNTIRDASLPKTVNIYTLGPGGVVLEEVFEGGEVKFVSIGSGSKTVSMRHFATGLEYNKDLFIFNQTWNVGIIERQLGIAYNALLNHLHLYPLVSYSYAAANQTAASSTGATLVEKYLRTLEDAITNAKTDTSNPRRGPFALLVNSGQSFMVERALNRVPQEGFSLQSSAISQIQSVIAYDGWTGTRGKKSTTYAGVTTGKALLVDLAYRDLTMQSYIKQDLQSEMGNPDISRFIKEQTVYDTYMGVYTDPAGAVEEITWPVS